jgi:hypothetical protein
MSQVISRRAALQATAGAAALPLVHIRSAHAAGKLSVGFWDHWVPEGNDVMKKQDERALARGADELRHPDQRPMRSHQPAQATGRTRCDGDVSGEASACT